MNERRKRLRTIITLPAMIAFEGTDVFCVITDISDDGARIRVCPGLVLPKKAYLRSAAAGMTMPGSVVWQDGRDVGVRF